MSLKDIYMKHYSISWGREMMGKKGHNVCFIEQLILKRRFYRSHFKNRVVMSIFLHRRICHSPNIGGPKHLGFSTVN